ncbi:hypothetical protein ES708_18805 [subsurface metagenome]
MGKPWYKFWQVWLIALFVLALVGFIVFTNMAP